MLFTVDTPTKHHDSTNPGLGHVRIWEQVDTQWRDCFGRHKLARNLFKFFKKFLTSRLPKSGTVDPLRSHPAFECVALIRQLTLRISIAKFRAALERPQEFPNDARRSFTFRPSA